MQLEARESLQRALRNVAIKCIKIETKIHHKKHKRDRIGLIQKPRGHKEDGASFPKICNTKSHKSMDKSYSKERNGGRETQVWRSGEQRSPRIDYKSHS